MVACAVLHNLALIFNDVLPEDDEIPEDDEEIPVPNYNNVQADGFAVRQALIARMFH